MTTDRFAADRERIAAAANAVPGNHLWLEPDDLHRLDAAISAFETLCEPNEWRLEWRKGTAWTLTHPRKAYGGMAHPLVNMPATRDHAADVCRLICEVLDREAKEEGR